MSQFNKDQDFSAAFNDLRRRVAALEGGRTNAQPTATLTMQNGWIDTYSSTYAITTDGFVCVVATLTGTSATGNAVTTLPDIAAPSNNVVTPLTYNAAGTWSTGLAVILPSGVINVYKADQVNYPTSSTYFTVVYPDKRWQALA